jgi:hypothetical protein
MNQHKEAKVKLFVCLQKGILTYRTKHEVVIKWELLSKAK